MLLAEMQHTEWNPEAKNAALLVLHHLRRTKDPRQTFQTAAQLSRHTQQMPGWANFMRLFGVIGVALFYSKGLMHEEDNHAQPVQAIMAPSKQRALCHHP